MRKRISPATVTATVALFFSLGGATAVAQAKPSRLTMRAARTAIVKWGDFPRTAHAHAVHCRRLSPVAVRCDLAEYGYGPLIGSGSWDEGVLLDIHARLLGNGKVHVTSPYWM